MVNEFNNNTINLKKKNYRGEQTQQNHDDVINPCNFL